MVSPSLFRFSELLPHIRPQFGEPFPMALSVTPDNAPAGCLRINAPLFGQKSPERDDLLQTALTGIANYTAAPAGVRVVSRQTSATGNGTNR
jgi:hypothetical protein